ncbi:MAG: OmpA family protein [Bacteroidetes bacterium]|nr:OmpA family protein [Bacteroidota bacterium]
MRQFIITLSLLAFVTTFVFGQEEPILLENASFEDMPRHSRQPRNWYDCGFPNESPPDTQPGQFDVTQLAIDGDSYMGLVVRENDTWEMVAQRLSAPLEGDKCYEFSIFLSRSELYLSPTKDDTLAMKNHTTPVKIRIWGGSGYCSKSELLAESSLVINTRWLEYNFKFEPKSTHMYILFEAFYKTPTLFPYNGNILIDNASPIFPVDCDVDTPKPPVDEPIVDQPIIDKPAVEQVTTPPVVINEPSTPPSNKPKILEELDRTNLRTGQKIRIEKLYFPMDEASFTTDSYDVLTEIYDFLSYNQDVKVEIGGHSNTIPDHDYCDRLSTDRAKAVVDFLISKGIDDDRLVYKGYGKRNPIAKNDKQSMAARRKNQRVEIKILGFDG